MFEKYFNDELGWQVENFLAGVLKEHELICNSKDYELKFFYKGKIIDGDDLKLKYLNNELNKDYTLIEANITLKDNISFYYFRKYLKIDELGVKDIVLERFKEVMA